MIVNVTIEKRIAKYVPSDEKLVCGNKGDFVQFAFDEEWAAHTNKTARFKWNNQYYDQEFSGDTCEIPVITRATSVMVGVYVGEPSDAEAISSTDAVIPCELSTRCRVVSASDGTGENYTNEAKGYAVEAKASAESAEASAQRVENKGKVYLHKLNLYANSYSSYEASYYSTDNTPFANIPTSREGDKLPMMLVHNQDMGGSYNYFYGSVVAYDLWGDGNEMSVLDAMGNDTPIIKENSSDTVMEV